MDPNARYNRDYAVFYKTDFPEEYYRLLEEPCCECGRCQEESVNNLGVEGVYRMWLNRKAVCMDCLYLIYNDLDAKPGFVRKLTEEKFRHLLRISGMPRPTAYGYWLGQGKQVEYEF